MSKYNLQEHVDTIFKNYEATFSEVSLDSQNNTSLCTNTTTKVYNFDKYITEQQTSTKLPASPDGIYVGKKNLYFVEFKNQQYHNIDKENIQAKFKEGTKILEQLIDKQQFKECNFYFCVVYQKNERTKFDYSGIEKNKIKFGLENINNYYTQIITDNVGEFKETFKQELQC